MPLIKIPNQPLFTDENNPTEEYCPGDYCHLVQSDDPMYVQWYQTPCGLNLGCDEDFTDVTLGSELIVTGCGNYTLGLGWTCNATISDPTFICTTPQATGTNVRFPNAGLNQYDQYKITFTVSSRTTGGVRVALGGSPSTTYSSWYQENGTFTVYLVMQSDHTTNDDFWIIPTGTAYNPAHPAGGFDGTVADITMKKVTSGCWDNGSGTWDIDGTGGACKTGSGTGVLTDNVGGNYLTSGEYYVMEYVVSNYAGGTLTPKVADITGTAISGNGTFKEYATIGANGVVAFTPDDDFIGCVDSMTVKLLKTDYTLTVVDNEFFAEIADVSSYLTYYNEYVTFCMKPEDIVLAEGCYRLYMYDDCDLQYGEYITNGSMTGGGTPSIWTPPPNWSYNVEGNKTVQWDFTSNQAKFIYGATFGESSIIALQSDPNLNFETGNYRITFDIVSNSDTVNNGIRVRIAQQTTTATLFKTVGTHTYDVAYTTPASETSDSYRVLAVSEFNTVGNFVIDNVSVTRLAPYSATFESECFKVSGQVAKSKLFIGTSTNEIFGFEFANSGFKLLQRLECRAFVPSWPTSKDSYTFSTGTKSLNYAEVQKLWEMFIEACPATSHGALALQMNCDNFYIGDTETDYKEYIVEDGDYNPEWDRTGASDLAPSRFSLRIKDNGTLFNRSC